MVRNMLALNLLKIPTPITHLEILVFGVLAEDEAVDGGLVLFDGGDGVLLLVNMMADLLKWSGYALFKVLHRCRE